jgi:hypothetical protein
VAQRFLSAEASAKAFSAASAGLKACATVVVFASTAHAQLPERPPLGSAITADALGMLPAPGNLFSLLDTAVPDVIADRIDTGGLSAGDPARVGAHGSSWTQTLFTLGDIDITDPRGSGTPLLLPGVDTWEHAGVATGLMPVDRSAPGLAITLTPRAPASNWSNLLSATGSPAGLNAAGDTGRRPSIARLNSWVQGGLMAGGPIPRTRVGLFSAFTATRSTHFERSFPDVIDSNLTSAFASLAAAPRAAGDLRAIAWLQRTRDPVDGHAAFQQVNAGEHRTAFHGQAAWTYAIPDRDAGVRTFLGFTGRRRTNTLIAPSFIAVERLRDGPIPYLLDAGPATERSWTAGAKFHAGFAPGASPGRATRHTLVAGLEAHGASATAQSTFGGIVGELIDGIPARLWNFTDPEAESRWHSTMVTGYVGATSLLHPRITVNGGLRLELLRAGRHDESSAVSWQRALPRAGIHWRMTDFMQLSSFAQYGAFGHRLLLRDLAWGDPAAPTGTVFRWNAPVSTTALGPNAFGPLVQRVGPGTNGDSRFSAIDPELRQPYMHEIITGFELRPRPSAFLRLAAIGRREHQLVGVVNVGVPNATYEPIGVPDMGVDVIGSQDDFTLYFFNRAPRTFGADRYLLTNPAGHDTSFVGADLTLQVRVPRWVFLSGITAGRSEGWSANRGFGPVENDAALVGEIFTNPNALGHAQGRLFTERGYTIKFANTLQFPADVDFGMVARYQDGQHFARIVIMPELNQGAEAVRAFRNGRTRFTFSMTVDARLQKAFRAGGRRRVAAVLDAYNLFNQALEVEEFSVTGATSRLTSAVQPPRVIQLGLRLQF